MSVSTKSKVVKEEKVVKETVTAKATESKTKVPAKAKAKTPTKAKTTFTLEIQHEDLNVTTIELETTVKTHLKKMGQSITGCDLKTFYVPATQMLYYSLEKNNEQVASGSLSLAR